MKKILIWILVLIVALVLVALMSFSFYFFQAKKPAATTPVGFPLATTTAGTTQQTQMTIMNQDGSALTTNDFIHNGTTIEDPANPGNYYLAGSSGYCYPDGTCPMAGTSKLYNIIYDSTAKSFIIGLLDEPLSTARMQAEQYLMQTLGITQAQMCSLHYYIGTTTYVNPKYGGDNLGFSFCPGATVLP